MTFLIVRAQINHVGFYISHDRSTEAYAYLLLLCNATMKNIYYKEKSVGQELNVNPDFRNG